MKHVRSALCALVAATSLGLLACGGSKAPGSDAGGSGAAGGVAGTYVSVADPEFSIQLGNGGDVVINASGLGKSKGTYTVDGEKLIVSADGRQYTFTRDGACISDLQHVFDKSCIGGKTGEESNVSTHVMPTPSGTWVATTTDGEFKLEFVAGNRFTMSATPPGGQPQVREGTYITEGDMVHARIGAEGDPLVLQWVNNSYESTSFGFPMKFLRKD